MPGRCGCVAVVTDGVCGAGRAIWHPDPASPFHVECAGAVIESLPLLPDRGEVWLCQYHLLVIIDLVADAYGDVFVDELA